MRIAMVVVLAAACGGSKSEDKPVAAALPQPKPEAAKPVTQGPAKPAAKRPPPTKAQLADYKKHMKSGWALQKDTKWAESVPEFEAALAAVPDQHAYAELGWSAMNAGDFAKARKADEQAVSFSADKKVRASALYNLGLVQEKTGDKDGALKSFLASLALRPNKTVEAAVGRLGATPTTEPVFCAAGKKPCDCVLAEAFDEIQLESGKCEPATTPALPVKTFKLFHVTSDAFYGAEWTYALDENNQLVGVVAGSFERGRHMDRTELVKADLKAIGGHYVLWLETKTTSEANYPTSDCDDCMEMDTEQSRQVTLCVVGDNKTKTRCPLRDVPLFQSADHGRYDGEGKPMKSDQTETVTELAIADDGTATVKLVRGASDPQLQNLVGPHKLW